MNITHHENQIDYVEFPVASAAAMKLNQSFYGTVFGWTYQNWAETYADTGSSGILSGLNGDREQPIAAPLVVIYTTNLEGVRTRIVESGGRITRDIFAFPGGRRFQYTDPAGNELGVWSDK